MHHNYPDYLHKRNYSAGSCEFALCRRTRFTSKGRDARFALSAALVARMSGAKLRKDPPDTTPTGSPRRGSPSPENQRPLGQRPLRILASGVVFLNHTISVKDFPEEGSNTRAQTVVRLRGGAAPACLSVVAQFADTQSWLVAPIGGGSEGSALRVELEREGINTQLCAHRESDGVPKAFVIKSS